jgi:acetolactate synthase-1/3 small subunit
MRKEQNRRRFVFSMYVDDEPGVLDRISGMFSRRGVNLDTVTVGATPTSKVSKIVVSFTDTPENAAQMEKQLQKVLTVKEIHCLNKEDSFIRELCLIKVSASMGQETEDIERIARDFDARVIDASEEEMILELCATTDAIPELIRSVEQYGVIDISRTGITAMRRAHPVYEEDIGGAMQPNNQ